MIDILFVGESWTITETHTKGFDSFMTSRYEEGGRAFRSALSGGGFRLTCMPSHAAAADFPWTRLELDEYDVVIFSDIGANTLLLTDAVFIRGETAPDRLRLLSEWTRDGGGFAMIGGYMSFQGIEGKANYSNTAISDVLPVDLLPADDRIETPDGSQAIVCGSHQITANVDHEWPPLLGYQRLKPRAKSTVLAKFDSDPLLVVGEFGLGRSLAFASDIDAHWAPSEFTGWDGFSILWRNAATWLSGGKNDFNGKHPGGRWASRGGH